MTSEAATISTTRSRSFAHQAIEALDHGAESVSSASTSRAMTGHEPDVYVFRHGLRTYVSRAGNSAVESAESGSDEEFAAIESAAARAWGELGM